MPLAELSKEEREIRQRGIGASEIGAIAGLNPWHRPIDVWLEKTGRAEPRPDDERSRMGKRIEALIAEWYCEEILADSFEKPKTMVHPSEPWMIATPDLFASVMGERRRCEIKLVGFRVRPHWQGAAGLALPDYVVSQTTWQGLVSGVEPCDVAVWFGVDRDQQHILPAPWMPDIAAELQQIGWDFWRNHVQLDIPPAVDDSESWRAYLDRLWPKNERALIGPAPDDADIWAERLILAKADVKDAEARKLEAENELKVRIGDLDGISRLGAWRATWKLDAKGCRRFLFVEEK